MPEGFPDGIELKPLDWPHGFKDDAPGNPEFFLSQGFQLGPPAVVFPYRDMPSDDYYGSQPVRGNPILDAPREDASGGTLYFRAGHRTDLGPLLHAMGIYADFKQYVAFAVSSAQPQIECYLDQMKFIRRSALEYLFKVKGDDLPGDQALTLGEAMKAFVVAQRDKWDDGYAFSRKLRGLAGGDGDWAKESLAFGMHVENSYWGVYRIWSRAWLATK